MKRVFSSKMLAGFLLVIAVVSLLIFFNSRGWLAAPRNIVYWGMSPILRSFQWVNREISSGIKTAGTLKDLIKENAGLVDENQQLWRENSELKEAKRENEIFRQRLDMGKTEDCRLILADIIGYDNQSSQYFLIDKGKNQGLSVDQAVVTANNFLVGKVSEVNQNYSKVLLVIDAGSLVNAITQDTRVSGIVKGINGLGLGMEMMPIDKEIKVGETILSSGKNSVIPKDLIIGKIKEIFSKENEIFQRATVEPAANLGELESVFILIKQTQ